MYSGIGNADRICCVPWEVAGNPFMMQEREGEHTGEVAKALV